MNKKSVSTQRMKCLDFRPILKQPGQVVDGFFEYPRKRRKQLKNGMVVLDVFLDGDLEANFVKLVIVLVQLLKPLGLRQFLRAPAVRLVSVLLRVHQLSNSDIDHHRHHCHQVHLFGLKKRSFNSLKTCRFHKWLVTAQIYSFHKKNEQRKWRTTVKNNW